MCDQPGAVEGTPKHEVPGRSVPQAAEQHGQHEISIGQEHASPIATQGDVEIIAQPGGQTNVPAAPEVGRIDGQVGLGEVERQFEPQEQRHPPAHVGIPRKVEVDLEAIAIHRDPVKRPARDSRRSEDLIDEGGDQEVGEDHFLDKSGGQQPEAATNLLGTRRRAGIDLRKEGGVLERAYDDSQGVTARFDLNLLARINRELGGDFDLEAFKHRATWLSDPGRVESHLVSTCAQRVQVGALGAEFSFAAGETIHTENSYKYSPAEIEELAAASGMRCEEYWLDADRMYRLNMFAPDQVR